MPTFILALGSRWHRLRSSGRLGQQYAASRAMRRAFVRRRISVRPPKRKPKNPKMASLLNNPSIAWMPVALMATPSAVPARAAQDAALVMDLTSVIALVGLTCGQVAGATRLSDDDHIATCNDGNRYQVYINAEGKVVAQEP
jgi:hypothetical protein